MRDAQPLALCLALCAFACNSDDPHRDVVDLVGQTNDPSTALDSSAPAPADGGGPIGMLPSSSGGNGSRGMDASTRDAASPVEASTDAGRSPYACETDNDCTIRDVGNCCGFYPRCANANAVFTPPDCSGGTVGACGFPAIDSCTCRQNLCRSLQAGVEL
jgi:hypothetical protein